MERMYIEAVQVKLVPKTSITEDFIDVKNFRISGYVEYLDGVFADRKLQRGMLNFDFGEYGIEFSEITDDYFETKNKVCLYAIILDCYSPMCNMFVIKDDKATKIVPMAIREVKEGNILCVHEDGRSVFIDRSEVDV